MAETSAIRKAEVCKVDQELGLVFGWGMICKENGADHYDLQGDHIPESVMVSATSDFMEHVRTGKQMHDGEACGVIVHSFPLTTEIAEKMGITTAKTGWMVAMKPDTEVLKRFADGTYRGFSIGGGCAYVEESA